MGSCIGLSYLVDSPDEDRGGESSISCVSPTSMSSRHLTTPLLTHYSLPQTTILASKLVSSGSKLFFPPPRAPIKLQYQAKRVDVLINSHCTKSRLPRPFYCPTNTARNPNSCCCSFLATVRDSLPSIPASISTAFNKHFRTLIGHPPFVTIPPCIPAPETCYFVLLPAHYFVPRASPMAPQHGNYAPA